MCWTGAARAELPFGAYGRAKRARRRLEAWFETMIAARRAGGDGDDVLSHMSRDTDEHGQPYAVKTIVDHMIFLLFAAHDTSTSALSHLAMYLGRDAALQGRLRTHLDSFGPGPLAHADLARMDLAEHCFHEAMRLHPPVPMMMRRLASLPKPSSREMFITSSAERVPSSPTRRP